MNKWLGLAVATFVAGAAFAQQDSPGAADFVACQKAAGDGKWDVVIASCEKALSANGDLFAGNYYLGYAYQAKKNNEECAANFDTFIKKVGNNPEAADMINRANREGGLCYAKAREPGKAIPFLQKAASNKPNDKEVQYYLGRTQMLTKNAREAERAFSKVIQLDASFALAYYYAGKINFDGQQWAPATERLQKFLELSPDHQFVPDVHFLLGFAVVQTADASPDAEAAKQLAATHFEQFLAAKPTAPQSAQAHYLLGSFAADKEDDATAKSHFEKFLQLEPNGPLADEVKAYLSDLAEAESGN